MPSPPTDFNLRRDILRLLAIPRCSSDKPWERTETGKTLNRLFAEIPGCEFPDMDNRISTVLIELQKEGKVELVENLYKIKEEPGTPNSTVNQ